jgi:hypothetical protein
MTQVFTGSNVTGSSPGALIASGAASTSAAIKAAGRFGAYCSSPSDVDPQFAGSSQELPNDTAAITASSPRATAQLEGQIDSIKGNIEVLTTAGVFENDLANAVGAILGLYWKRDGGKAKS